MLTHEVLSAFTREIEKIAFATGAGDSVMGFAKDTVGLLGQQAGMARDLLHPGRTVETVRKIIKSSGNMSSGAVADRAQELSSANAALREAGKPGAYIGGTAAGFGHNPAGVLGKARAGGWLANYGKYTGPSNFLKARNMVARALPGQRTMLAASTLPLAYSSMKKQDAQGNARGWGERTLGTAGALTGTLATQSPSIVRALGKANPAAGMLAGVAGSMLLGSGLSRAGQYAGRKIDHLAGAAPTAPQTQPIQNRPT